MCIRVSSREKNCLELDSFPCLHSQSFKHERGWNNSRQLGKPETKSRVCITVENSPNPWVFISGNANKGKQFSIAFIKSLPLKITTREETKKNHFTDQNVSSYNINLTMVFLNWPIRTYISNLVIACLQFVYLYVTHRWLHTPIQPRLSANRSAIRARVLS